MNMNLDGRGHLDYAFPLLLRSYSKMFFNLTGAPRVPGCPVRRISSAADRPQLTRSDGKRSARAKSLGPIA